ncbi:MAG: VIT family protein [Thermoleophilia bacterium]|jgi:VIT1/CCC1 family predicted Fe2+/Mn2+ transporter|nr:VIT family protein [Thermoleophilia bacterium]
MSLDGSRHPEVHVVHRTGWLRAGVLGANDGIVSTASLVLGVAAAGSSRGAVITAGVAGLVAGAMSMAAGEYVSVSSQRDAERADIDRERRELEEQPELELDELTQIYVARGLSASLARQVAVELTAGDALAVHARDELGLAEMTMARPLQAAVASGLAFTAGAVLPLAAIAVTASQARIAITVVVALVALLLLGAVGARFGGARVARAAGRVVVWGAAAMALTMAIGALVGTAV